MVALALLDKMKLAKPSAVKQGIYKRYGYIIKQDEDSENPRDDNNLGTMVCSHSKYTLGDVQLGKDDGFLQYIDREFSVFEETEGDNDNQGWTEKVESWIEEHLHVVDLYLYDHSGITMRTYPFADSWDSGQVGIIFITKEDCADIPPGDVLEHLRDEVATYDQWLQGEVYGYNIISPCGEDTEYSCWGFFGIETAINEAKSLIDYESARLPYGEAADAEHENLAENMI